MKEHPILFSVAMVRAILDGRKTQTRRACKGQRDLSNIHDFRLDGCPYGQPGDRLWVRESVWTPRPATPRDLREGADTWPKCIYSADTDDTEIEWMRDMRWKQRPSIHMPRWASRITLEVTDVRVQRVQDISETDALAEGCSSQIRHSAAFADLWDSINERRGFGWEVNPWVWVITFRKVEELPA